MKLTVKHGGETVIVDTSKKREMLCVECFMRKPINQFQDTGATCDDCREYK